MPIEHLASQPAGTAEAYLITFACYGNHLHGDPRGSIDRNHNAFRGRYVEEDHERAAAEKRRMKGDVVTLKSADRRLVLGAVIEVCDHRRWRLNSVHVRSTHVHAVIAADTRPERVLGDIKAYASRALNRERGWREKRWAHHGSTIYLWSAGEVHDAVEYVHARQGRPMARYTNPVLWPQFAMDDQDEPNDCDPSVPYP